MAGNVMPAPPAILKIIDEVIGIEGDGGGKADPNDPGGATRWGVTEAVARADGYEGPMDQLPRERAVSIYLRKYFYAPGFHHILPLSEAIAAELFEVEVNLPPGKAATFLQRALNGLNDPHGKGVTLFPNLEVDGDLGTTSLGALEKFLGMRKREGELALLKLQNAQQAVYYIERTEKRPKSKKFLFGWTLKRVEI